THPLHALFNSVDAETAADGTTLQHELHCSYYAKKRALHKHSAGKRLGKWGSIDLDILRDHMTRGVECNHSTAVMTFAMSLLQPARTTHIRVCSQHQKPQPAMAATRHHR